MENILPDDLPLLSLFDRLRSAGLPLGISDYQLVIKALQAGFGIPDRESLARLCRTLWIKSSEEEQIFDYHFAQLFPKVEQTNSSEKQSAAIRHSTGQKKGPVRNIFHPMIVNPIQAGEG